MPRIKVNDLKAEKALKTEEMSGVRGGGARFRGRSSPLDSSENQPRISLINYRGSGVNAVGEVWGTSAPAYSYSNWFRRSYGNYAVYG